MWPQHGTCSRTYTHMPTHPLAAVSRSVSVLKAKTQVKTARGTFCQYCVDLTRAAATQGLHCLNPPSLLWRTEQASPLAYC